MYCLAWDMKFEKSKLPSFSNLDFLLASLEPMVFHVVMHSSKCT